MADKNETAQAIADFLFRDGTNRQADRLLLITEDYSGKAKVTDAQYLGGWSKAVVVDAVSQILKANKISPSDFEQLIRLRDWKESAMTLLSRYDQIAETFGGKLGSSKIDNLEQGVERVRKAATLCAIPYEALLMDSASRKWIAPEVWTAIENAVAALREALAHHSEEGARS